MVGLYLMYFYWRTYSPPCCLWFETLTDHDFFLAPYVLAVSLLQANTAGFTKRSVVFSIATIGCELFRGYMIQSKFVLC